MTKWFEDLSILCHLLLSIGSYMQGTTVFYSKGHTGLLEVWIPLKRKCNPLLNPNNPKPYGEKVNIAGVFTKNSVKLNTVHANVVFDKKTLA